MSRKLQESRPGRFLQLGACGWTYGPRLRTTADEVGTVSGGESQIVIAMRVEENDPIADDRRRRAVDPRAGENENPSDQRTD